jgi:hypothetical protein
MTDRELMQQALDALEIYGAKSPDVADTITVLRERLEQPEQQCAHGIDQKECRWCGPSQQAQEPVAWISHSQNLLSWDKFYDDMTPLYTAPQAQQPLTDEQISDLWCKVSNTDFVTMDTHEFARAIEAKLKEKNS